MFGAVVTARCLTAAGGALLSSQRQRRLWTGWIEDMRGLINRLRALTGIYSLGFERESMMGVTLPVAFVVITLMSTIA